MNTQMDLLGVTPVIGSFWETRRRFGRYEVMVWATYQRRYLWIEFVKVDAPAKDVHEQMKLQQFLATFRELQVWGQQ